MKTPGALCRAFFIAFLSGDYPLKTSTWFGVDVSDWSLRRCTETYFRVSLSAYLFFINYLIFNNLFEFFHVMEVGV
jgi:hypothetical protein